MTDPDTVLRMFVTDWCNRRWGNTPLDWSLRQQHEARNYLAILQDWHNWASGHMDTKNEPGEVLGHPLKQGGPN